MLLQLYLTGNLPRPNRNNAIGPEGLPAVAEAVCRHTPALEKLDLRCESGPLRLSPPPSLLLLEGWEGYSSLLNFFSGENLRKPQTRPTHELFATLYALLALLAFLQLRPRLSAQFKL